MVRRNDMEAEGSHRKSRMTETKRNGLSFRPNKIELIEEDRNDH